LAEALHDHLTTNSNLHDHIETSVKKYWDDTLRSFDVAESTTWESWEKHINGLRTLADDSQTSKADLERAASQVQSFQDFLRRLPRLAVEQKLCSAQR
jgi:hypothetical protein